MNRDLQSESPITLFRNGIGEVVGCAVACFFILSLMSGCAWNIDTARKIASITTLGSTGVEAERRKEAGWQRSARWLANTTGYGGIQPDDRAMYFLRTFSLEDEFRKNPVAVVLELRRQVDQTPDLERLHVLAELSSVEGRRARIAGDEQYAGQMLATSVAASFEYLFDPSLDHERNAYDPVFRKACDTYNQSLEGLLRIMKKQEALRPGGQFTASTLDGRPLKVAIQLTGRWQDESMEEFEFVSDFDTKGLRNVHHTYGLGVPLIAVRKAAQHSQHPDDQFYPADLSMPLTAFVTTPLTGEPGISGEQFTVQLVDPLERNQVKVGQRVAPLESDITTPLAYFLDDPLLDANWFATAALLNGDFADQFGGMYLLEPYDSTKIPVVMVHGFWSSPMTWTEMFNDLRADKSIRDNYQFWFYLYPSGQPFWISARQMREDLAKVRQTLDPDQASRAMDEMVLVGHSMGGLVSRLQTIQSGEDFWNLVSSRNINELQGDPVILERIRDTLYFSANPSVARVVSLGTPHKGSVIANSLTRWLSEKVFTLPSVLTKGSENIVKLNPGFFDSNMLAIRTSTDSLSPDSRFFDVMLQAEKDPFVIYHNIIGVAESSGPSRFFSRDDEPTDGVVSRASARCPDAVSEIEITAEHSAIHQHPRAVLEVKRILREHLNQVFAQRNSLPKNVVRPAGFDQSIRNSPSGNVANQKIDTRIDPRIDR